MAAFSFVVDNESTDECMNALKNCFPSEDRLNHICSDRKLGFFAGCNLGIEPTLGSHVLFSPGSLRCRFGGFEPSLCRHDRCDRLDSDGAEQGGYVVQ